MLPVFFPHFNQSIAEYGHDILQGVSTVCRLVNNGQPMRASHIRLGAQVALCKATSLYRQSSRRLNKSGLNNGVKFLCHAKASIESAMGSMMEEGRGARNGTRAVSNQEAGSLFLAMLDEVCVKFLFNQLKCIGENLLNWSGTPSFRDSSSLLHASGQRSSSLNNGRMNNRIVLFAHGAFLALTKPNRKMRLPTSFVKAHGPMSACP
jgi:hypothetical protein